MLEIKDRLRSRLTSLSEEEWLLASHNIRTQHAFCWSGLRADYELLNHSSVNDFAREYGWRLSQKYATPSQDDFYSAAFESTFFMSEDDKVFFQINLNRLRLLPPETGLAYEGERTMAIQMDHDYECWKAQHGWTDFTGMVEHGIERKSVPDGIRYILVDEAQDLCPLLFEYHKVLYEAHPEAEVTWYGDEDQCIYEFMGADPSIFVNQPATDTVFGEISHRLPANIAASAHEYISRNKNRLPKDIKGQDKPGIFSKQVGVEAAATEAILDSKGLILWLCPTNAQCDRVKEKLRELGYALKMTSEEKECVRALQLLASKPRRLKVEDLRLLTEAKLGGKKLFPFTREWFVEPLKFSIQVKAWLAGTEDLGLVGLDVEDVRLSDRFQSVWRDNNLSELFKLDDTREKVARALLANKEEDYWIEVTTFHKSKGREADTVVVLKDVAGKMLSSILYDPEAGRRAGFVAMTRTRHKLILYRQEHERCRDWYKVTW